MIKNVDMARDTTARLITRLGVLTGTVLVDLDLWGVGGSVAAWVVRVAFNSLILWQLILLRAQIGKLLPTDRVVARAPGRRRLLWQGVAVIFTDSEVVAFKRSIWTGAVGKRLREAPYRDVQLALERRGPLFDHVRCDWTDGTQMHVRLRLTERRRLGMAIESSAQNHESPLTRVADWLRAGTRYED
jgi:hypothetical protein